MAAEPMLIELPTEKRLYSVRREIRTKGYAYLCEDVRRRDVLVVAQRMRYVAYACEELCCETCAISSLYESATLALKKGKTGSFRVRRATLDELPSLLEERRRFYKRTVLAICNETKWSLVAATTASVVVMNEVEMVE